MRHEIGCVDISVESIADGSAYIYMDKELQRVSRDALKQLDEQGVKFRFPSILACKHTVLVLKETKTKASVRKGFLPKAVAEMLVERKKEVEELKELLGDEYIDYGLVFASSSGTPIEGAVILDDDRQMNAQRFQEEFYSTPEPQPETKVEPEEKQAMLLKLLAESPELIGVFKAMAQAL